MCLLTALYVMRTQKNGHSSLMPLISWKLGKCNSFPKFKKSGHLKGNSSPILVSSVSLMSGKPENSILLYLIF